MSYLPGLKSGNMLLLRPGWLASPSMTTLLAAIVPVFCPSSRYSAKQQVRYVCIQWSSPPSRVLLYQVVVVVVVLTLTL